METQDTVRPEHCQPENMEPYDAPNFQKFDLGALSITQQNDLNKLKIDTRISNEAYLRRHPEIRAMISGFLRKAVQDRPENIRQFAADYFTDSALPAKVQTSIKQYDKKIEDNINLRKTAAAAAVTEEPSKKESVQSSATTQNIAPGLPPNCGLRPQVDNLVTQDQEATEELTE